MSAPPAAIPALPAASAARPVPSWRRWLPAATLLSAGWFAVDLGHQAGHWLSGGASFSLAAAAAAALWLWRPRRRTQLVETDLQGWLERLDALLPRFEALGGDAGERPQRLAELRRTLAASQLQIAVVGMEPADAALQGALAAALAGPAGLTVHWADPLPRWSSCWSWPAPFAACDLLIHRLRPPLGAAELRWIEAMPSGQPAWLLVAAEPTVAIAELRRELEAQLPPGCGERLLFWNGDAASLPASLEPLSVQLGQTHRCWRQATRLRLARDLHRSWQAELERLRRQHLDTMLNRTQWAVAAGVVAAPLPSLDLLVLAVANGLMLQEMARLWQCPWSGEQLRAAAAELARASLALGVVEWSTQALAGLLRLHAATWLVGGAAQALSAAYLTRVVAGAMADVLALSSGVDAPDLERIKREAPLLVARAAERERLDWQGFVQQGRQWLREQASAAAT